MASCGNNCNMDMYTGQLQTNKDGFGEEIFKVKRKCFRTLYGTLVEPKCSIQVHVERPDTIITRIVCRTRVKEQKKESAKKKKKSSKSKNQLHQKDYSLVMIFDYDPSTGTPAADGEEPLAKRQRRELDPSPKIAVVDKTLVFRYKLRDRPITEEKVAKNVENPIVMKRGQLSILDYFEVPHMLTACLPSLIEVDVFYKITLDGDEYQHSISEFVDEAFIFLSRVPDIVQVQKYFNSLLKTQGKISLDYVQTWLLEIMKMYYCLELTDAQQQYILKDMTLNERDFMIQFASNIYQFQQCLQYTSKHTVPALKFIWENKYVCSTFGVCHSLCIYLCVCVCILNHLCMCLSTFSCVYVYLYLPSHSINAFRKPLAQDDPLLAF